MKALITTPRGETFNTFFTKENIELAESLGEIIWNDTEKHFTIDEVKERISDCDVYVTAWGSPRLDAEIIAAAPKLKLLTHLCGSVKPVITDAVWENGIRVLTGNDYFAESVAEGTLAYMLAALRDIPFYSHRLKYEKKWKTVSDKNFGLAGKKIGILSYGAVAKHTVRLLSNFRTEIYVYDIKPLPEEDVKKYNLRQASLEEIFSTCDIISVHTPKIPATYHMVNAKLFSMIRPGALFVNTARGAVIDQRALEEELKDGRFRAVLDVYDPEPPTADSPLYSLPNVMMMPHQGGPTIDFRRVITHDLMIESASFIDRGEASPHEISREAASLMTE